MPVEDDPRSHSFRLNTLEEDLKEVKSEMKSFHNFRVNVYILLAFIAGTGIFNMAAAMKLVHIP